MKKILLLSILALAAVVAQAATKYEINVGGVEVNSDNASNVTGGAITKLSSSGKVSYNASTNTLTLTDISISRSGSSDRAIHNRNCTGLRIVLDGTCKFSGSAASTLYFQKSTTIEVTSGSEATVTCTSSGDDAIYFNNSGTLTITGRGYLKLQSTKGEVIEGGSNPSLSISIARLDIGEYTSTARENIKNFKTVSFSKPAYGSQVKLSQTASGYAHISSGTTITTASGLLYWEQGNRLKTYPAETMTANLTSTNNGGWDLYIRNWAVWIDVDFHSQLHDIMLSKYPSGFMSSSEVAALTSLDISGCGITDMYGISELTGLKTLNCANNSFEELYVWNMTSLTTLNASGNTKLKDIWFGSDQYNDKCANLQTLNLSGCTALPKLECKDLSLTSLNVAGCSALTEIDCSGNKFSSLSVTGLNSLATLDVSGMTSLTTLNAYNNPKLTTIETAADYNLQSVNAYGNTSLSSFSITNRSLLTSLDLHGCSALTTLNCYENKKLSSLNITGCSALTSLNCSGDALTSLNMSNFSKLQTLNCTWNSLTSLNLSGCSALTELSCASNKFTSLSITGLNAVKKIDASNNTSLTTLNCSNNPKLATLDIGGCKSLKTLYCNKNALTSLNVADATSLDYLDAGDNASLTTLSLNANTALTWLNISNTGITSLYLGNNAKLRQLFCSYAPLTTLDVSNHTELYRLDAVGCSKLTNLKCSNCALTTLNFSGCTALKTLHCYYNKLTALNFGTELKALEVLDCFNNQITTLDASNLSALKLLSCNGNPGLTTLTGLSGNSNLTKLYCTDCRLTSLDLSRCVLLNELNFSYNKVSTIDIDRCVSLQKVKIYSNELDADKMTAFVTQLPANPGDGNYLYAIVENDNNVFNNSHVSAAFEKGWLPYHYVSDEGWKLFEQLRGDVNNDGSVNTGDISEIYGIILGTITDPETIARAKINDDDVVNTGDVSELYSIILGQ